MILSSSWFVRKSLVGPVAPIFAVVLGTSLALKAQNVIGPQWRWVSVNIDTQSRPSLTGPTGISGLTWNECISTTTVPTKTNLLNSNGVATSIGFSCNATNVASDWGSPELELLTGSAFNFSPFNSPMSVVISGLTPGKKYSLYLCSYVPNELGSRNIYTTTNTTTSGNTQTVDNGGPWGKSNGWLRGVNYARYENMLPDATNSIRLTLTSGSPNHRAHLSGFQLIEDPTAATSPYATWLAGFSFASIPGADLALDADPDRDSYTNMEEFILNLNPTLANRRTGRVMTESWNSIPGRSVTTLVAAPKFYQQPDAVNFLAPSNLKFDTGFAPNPNSSAATRSRAYITPTVSGLYTFWLSARNSAELYLSTDLTLGKYAKRKIAAMGSDLDGGPGIGWQETNLWDRFAGQQSAVLSLSAGQTYYLEIDHHGGGEGGSHSSVAWARNGGVREMIPDALFSSYTKTPDDRDDDFLPDAWESLHGLNPVDNGYYSIRRQGARGDYDSDGLTNREEYLLGTNPANSDTDSDGATDSAEVRTYRTSPTVSNLITTTPVASPLLSSYNANNTSGTWQMFDGGLIADSFRGYIEWSFTVPTSGWYLLELETRLKGRVRLTEEMSVSLAVDSKAIPNQTISFTNGVASPLSFLSPQLSAGSHKIRLAVNNEVGRRNLQILSLTVKTPGGFDGNSNGRADWVDSLLAAGSTVLPFAGGYSAGETFVSPLFVEGTARYRSTTNVSVDGYYLTVSKGLSDQHWYVDAPLRHNQVTTLSVNFEDRVVSSQVTWARWNALSGQGITIRVGDSLKIGGWRPSITVGGNLSIQVQGQTVSMNETGYTLQTFDQAGTFPVVVNHSAGLSVTALVTVVSANFGSSSPFYTNYVVRKTFSNVPNSLTIVGDPSLRVDGKLAAASGQSVLLSSPQGGLHTLAAHLPSGPIVSFGVVQTLSVSDSLDSDAGQYIGISADGYSVMRAPLVVTDLPVGARVVVTIFRGGLTFMDGTTVKTFTASDFTNGVTYLQFRSAPGSTGGYCHHIDVFDSQNNFLGRR